MPAAPRALRHSTGFGRPTSIAFVRLYVYISIYIDTYSCRHDHADIERWIGLHVYVPAEVPALRHSTGCGRSTSIALVRFYMRITFVVSICIHVGMNMQIYIEDTFICTYSSGATGASMGFGRPTSIALVNVYIYICICIDTCTCIHEHADFDR